MFGSDQFPDGDVLLAAPAAIPEVSAVMVLEAAVVSAALFSFFAHAASASAANPRRAVLVVALVVMLSVPPITKV
jgi:hypothetical protein